MKFCTNCGFKLEDHYQVCPNCGCSAAEPARAAEPQPTPQPAPQPVYTPPVAAAPVTEANLPEQYRPLSPWAYFGLNLLFAIPIVGLIFLIVFSFKKTNINRRNYARSFFCALLVAVIAFVIFLVIMLALGKSIDFIDQLKYKLS